MEREAFFIYIISSIVSLNMRNFHVSMPLIFIYLERIRIIYAFQLERDSRLPCPPSV